MRWLKILMCAFLLNSMALAELPPLSPEDRLESADLIVSGQVSASSSRRERVTVGSNRVYTLSIKVTEVSKGDFPAGGELTALCWKAENRPEGWVGPGGQYHLPKQGDKGTFYLRRDTHGHFHLLNPNGWDN